MEKIVRITSEKSENGKEIEKKNFLKKIKNSNFISFEQCERSSLLIFGLFVSLRLL